MQISECLYYCTFRFVCDKNAAKENKLMPHNFTEYQKLCQYEVCSLLTRDDLLLKYANSFMEKNLFFIIKLNIYWTKSSSVLQQIRSVYLHYFLHNRFLNYMFQNMMSLINWNKKAKQPSYYLCEFARLLRYITLNLRLRSYNIWIPLSAESPKLRYLESCK